MKASAPPPTRMTQITQELTATIAQVEKIKVRLTALREFLQAMTEEDGNIPIAITSGVAVTFDPHAGFAVGLEIKNQWASAYPACEIDQELHRAHAWVTANWPKSKKKNWTRFLVNWLSANQERGGHPRFARPGSNGHHPPQTQEELRARAKEMEEILRQIDRDEP